MKYRTRNGPITHETRARIRAAIDQQARERHQAFLEDTRRQVCRECAGEWDNVTRGCKVCTDRNQRRLRRQKGLS